MNARQDLIPLAPDYDDVAPDASAMIESMRAHGYTLPTALADLIDNSIAAGSRNIWIHFCWEADDSWISVTDDGRGMTEAELVAAMRLGSRSPLEDRDVSDLGRFGLGLKTASFSQARRLTVITRCKGSIHVRRWDLDHLARPEVRGWQLLRYAHPESGSRALWPERADAATGTRILLERLDRVVESSFSGESDKNRADHFLWKIECVRRHIGMVFHRFLSRKPGALRIYLNDELIPPWDPFLEEHPATQVIGTYSQSFGSHAQAVLVKGFVLPHRDRFATSQLHELAGGPSGWNAHQGFYVYRGQRLIIAGDWLQLGWQKEEHIKLARIRLDIPNSMDHEWQIDVKKSAAETPAVLRGWLTQIAAEVRKTAREVYAHRGKRGQHSKKAKAQSSPWIASGSGGEFQYRIDRKHVVLAPLIQSLPASKKDLLDVLLRLVEETVPVQRIWIDTAENQDGAVAPFAHEKSKRLKQIIELCFESMPRHSDLEVAAAWSALAAFEGFSGDDAQAIIAALKEKEK